MMSKAFMLDVESGMDREISDLIFLRESTRVREKTLAQDRDMHTMSRRKILKKECVFERNSKRSGSWLVHTAYSTNTEMHAYTMYMHVWIKITCTHVYILHTQVKKECLHAIDRRQRKTSGAETKNAKESWVYRQNKILFCERQPEKCIHTYVQTNTRPPSTWLSLVEVLKIGLFKADTLCAFWKILVKIVVST